MFKNTISGARALRCHPSYMHRSLRASRSVVTIIPWFGRHYVRPRAVCMHRRPPISNVGGAWRYVSVQDVGFRKNAHPFGRGGRKSKWVAPRACACGQCWGWGVHVSLLTALVWWVCSLGCPWCFVVARFLAFLFPVFLFGVARSRRGGGFSGRALCAEKTKRPKNAPHEVVRNFVVDLPG